MNVGWLLRNLPTIKLCKAAFLLRGSAKKIWKRTCYLQTVQSQWIHTYTLNHIVHYGNMKRRSKKYTLLCDFFYNYTPIHKCISQWHQHNHAAAQNIWFVKGPFKTCISIFRKRSIIAARFSHDTVTLSQRRNSPWTTGELFHVYLMQPKTILSSYRLIHFCIFTLPRRCWLIN